MITHELLLELGFASVPNRPTQYAYKGWMGRLDENTFTFHGPSLPIANPADLRYFLMLIDYDLNSKVRPYPFHEN